jgi:uncharacterized membrane protein YidH (DUF202 family)
MYGICVGFSLVAKFFDAFWGGMPPYTNLTDLEIWINGLLYYGRFTQLFALLGTLFIFLFRVVLFEPKFQKKEKSILGVFILCTITFQILGFQFDRSTGKSVEYLDLIAFILLLLFCIVTYVPFVSQILRERRKIEGAEYKRAYLSIGIMAIGFCLIFICFLLDQLMFALFNWSYSVFYWAAWIFAILAFFSGYFGYIQPKSRSQIE